MQLNRDVFAAIFLLVLCGAFLNASFDIDPPLFDQMSSALWPRIILVPLTLLSLVYLARSLLGQVTEVASHGGPAAWFTHYRNPIMSFGLFLVFLLTLPVLGMLIGGVFFVFSMLTVIGGWAPRQIFMHATIAIISVSAMWAIFTFGLGVFLPTGMIANFH